MFSKRPTSTIYMPQWNYTWNKNARLKKTQSVYFHQDILLPDMWHFNQAPWESIRLYSRNKKVFQSGHMHGVHENACLTCLFIARNSPLVWAGRHKDISKHKLRPAKSWVARLISKRRQCSAEAKDPILVITLPPAPTPPPLPKTPRHSCCVRLFEHQFLWARILVTSQRLSPGWLSTKRPVRVMQLVKSHF